MSIFPLNLTEWKKRTEKSIETIIYLTNFKGSKDEIKQAFPGKN